MIENILLFLVLIDTAYKPFTRTQYPQSCLPMKENQLWTIWNPSIVDFLLSRIFQVSSHDALLLNLPILSIITILIFIIIVSKEGGVKGKVV